MNGQPSTVIPRWQGVIVVLSLVVLTAVLLLPLASVLLGLWGVNEAHRLTWDRDEAEDLVHGVIISVCLISDRVTDIPRIFRSVREKCGQASMAAQSEILFDCPGRANLDTRVMRLANRRAALHPG